MFNFSGPIPAGLNASPSSTSINAGGSATFMLNTLSHAAQRTGTFSIAGCPPVSTCTFSAANVVAGGTISAERSDHRKRRRAATGKFAATNSDFVRACDCLGNPADAGSVYFAEEKFAKARDWVHCVNAFVMIVSYGCGITADNPPAPVVGTTTGVYHT